MGVKTIFKILIGTTASIIVFALVVNLIGVTMTSVQLRTDLRKAILSGCDLYSQESFRTTTSGGTAMANNVPKVKYIDSTTGAISSLKCRDGSELGKFYKGATSDAIFSNMYGDTSKLLSALGDAGKQKFEDINGIGDRMGSEGSGVKMNISPMNLGYVYMDKDTLERMVVWSFAKNLTINSKSGGSEYCKMIDKWLHDNGDDTVYIKKGGFLIAIEDFRINEIEYKTYQLSEASDREELQKIIGAEYGDCDGSEVRLAHIKCSVPIKYDGIVLFDKLVEMMYGGVEGIDGTVQGGYNTSGTITMNRSASDNYGYDGGANAGNTLMGDIYYYNIV